MNTLKYGGLMVLALMMSAPVVAQSQTDWNGQNGPRDRDRSHSVAGGWDHDSFWSGAPDGIRERIDFLEQRIQRGKEDGTLDRREARNATRQLNAIRSDVQHMRGTMGPEQRDRLQARLDDLSRQLHWRHDERANWNNGSPTGWNAPRAPTNSVANASPYGSGVVDEQRFATNYDAKRDYRDAPQYSERQLGAQDQVYRGSDGRYYCKRNDGTTGLIIGAVGGGVLGNVIDGGHQRAAGTLIGGALGALVGKSIDQNSNVRCK